MSLDAAIVDISRTFAHGMGYVALSRVRTLAGLTLTGFSRDALRMHPRIIAFDTKLQQMSRNAEARIASLTRPEITKKQERFIFDCGGSLVANTEETSGTKKRKKSTKSTGAVWKETLQQFLEGKSIASIVKNRELTHSTILNHLEKAVEAGEHLPKKLFASYFKPAVLKKILGALDKVEKAGEGEGMHIKLSPTKSLLEDSKVDCSFEDIRIARMLHFLEKSTK